MSMSKDRRLVVVLAGLLAAVSASLPRISGALRIPETILLCGVAVAEVLLIIRLYVISRRACHASAKSSPE